MTDYCEVRLGDVAFRLQEEHDFGWLRRLGTVFEVFDQQDSGNISFGVERNAERFFVKYAGAKTINFSGDPGDAITNLRNAAALYKDLRHPSLIELVDHFEINSGYAAVFKWFDGESLHPHWSYPPPAKYNDPASPFYRFRRLPLERRLAALENVFSFHAFIEKQGYVAVDFYDGSLLYGFRTHDTKICDIDLYQSKPFTNTMGRLWGSSRFMAPEEFIKGSPIDERTNVFAMGAAAFALLGGELDRSYAKWEAGAPLYEAALKAVEADRQSRYESVSAFKSAWDLARRSNSV